MNIFLWSLGALITGFLLDMILGDPYSWPHIVRWMGGLTLAFEKRLRSLLPRTEKGEKLAGTLIVIALIVVCTSIPLALLTIFYLTLPPLAYIFESLLCWQCLAARSLKTESMKVYRSLLDEDIDNARKDISMIVGRDVSTLDKDGITRAAIETIAENTADGVAAPLIFMMLGGAPLGCIYKAVNTMDSMLGYKNEKYIYFGRAAAKVDDLLNYIPSRLCALLMIVSAFILRFDGKSAFHIWRRDRRKHASPNSAQTEAACAGALGIRLGGPIVYFGVTHDKPFIGDEIRPIQVDDIRDTNRLLYATSILTLIFSTLFRLLCMGVIFYASR